VVVPPVSQTDEDSRDSVHGFVWKT